jgi:hypothetical protein
METKKEAFKKFVIEQLKDFDYWREASPEGYAETITDEAVKLFCQPDVVGRSEQFYCTCSRAKGLDHDEDGKAYCIDCGKYLEQTIP